MAGNVWVRGVIMRLKSLFLVASAIVAGPAMAANLVTNGGFEADNTGFTSTYRYVAATGDTMRDEGTYTVGTNAANYHSSWASVGAVEGSKFFIANGSPTSDAPAWQQTLTGLTVGFTYRFSAYATNVCCNASFGGPNVTPIIIAVGTGGVPTQITTVTEGTVGTTGLWRNISGTFVATATSTQLSIFTDTAAASGNDFGLDAISVTAVPEPATWAMMIGGFGLIGAASRRRRSSVVFA